MKWRTQRTLVIFVLLSLCLSFCNINAYAKSKYYDKGENYNDSYLKDGFVDEDSSLIFFPPFPDSQYKEYIIILSEGNYYLVLTNDKRVNFYGSYMVATQSTYVVYQYAEHDRIWIYSDDCKKYYPWNRNGNYKTFKNYKIIDSSILTDSGVVIEQNKYSAKTGYRFYWQIISVEKFLIKQIEYISDYVLSNKILTYIVLGGFAAEVLFFVFKLIRRVGDLRYEQEDSSDSD